MSSDTYSRFCPAARKIERRSVSHAQIQVALLGINAESRRSRNHRHLAFAATSLSKQVEVASTINFAFPSLIHCKRSSSRMVLGQFFTFQCSRNKPSGSKDRMSNQVPVPFDRSLSFPT